MLGMRWKISCLLAVSVLMGCVGPGQHVRGGHRGGFGGYHHHHDPVGGFLALLEGVALIADLAADASATQATLDSQQRVVVASPPAPEPVRPLPAWFQGRVLLPSTRVTLPEIRLGVRSAASRSFVAIFDSDPLGRFSFAVPPAGAYTLVVLDPEYQGEMTFASNGRTAFPLEFPILPRTPQVPSASVPSAAPQLGQEIPPWSFLAAPDNAATMPCEHEPRRTRYRIETATGGRGVRGRGTLRFACR